MARKLAKSTPSRPSARPSDEPTEGAFSSPGELVQQGLSALDAYDYELARTLLTRAFELSGGEEAARALLTLFVDHLAADQEALQLGDRLSREVLASPGVRLALALAAARCGDPQRARAHLVRLEGSAAADVLVALAEAAVASGDVDEAARLCDEARAHDAAHPGVRKLAHWLAQAREDERRPHEMEIELFLAEGLLDEARALAEQLLARHPESAVARRATRAALDQARADEAAQRVSEAEASLTEVEIGALKVSYEVARIAVAAAPADEQLAGRLARVGAELAERELVASAAGVVRRLGGSDDRDGLADYASQSPEVRARIRELTRLAILDDLEPLLARRAAPDEAIDAARAYREAASAELHPREALQRLASHERALAGFGPASRLAAQLRQRLRESRRGELLDGLTAARAALDGGDPSAALERLGRESFHDLDPAERELAEALRTAARAALATHQLEATYERLLREGPALAACELAEQLLARANEAERPRRQDQLAAARAAVRHEFGVWVAREDDQGEAQAEARRTIELGAPLKFVNHGEEPLPWLAADARSLVLLECCDRWVFLQDLDLAFGRVRTRIVMQTPAPMATVAAMISPAGNFVIASDHGWVLELSCETWQPLSWRSIGRKLGRLIDDVALAPDGRHVWVVTEKRVERSACRVEVLDLERRRGPRTISEGWWFRPLFGLEEPLMAHSRDDGELSLHYPSGATAGFGTFEFAATVRAVVAHPRWGHVLVFLVDDAEDGPRLGFAEIDSTGRSHDPRWLDDLDPEKLWVCATSLDQRTSFLAARGEEGYWLQALGRKDPMGWVETRYRVPLPGEAALVHDPASRHVVALIQDGERLHAVPLAAVPPQFPERTSSTARRATPGLTLLCPATPGRRGVHPRGALGRGAPAPGSPRPEQHPREGSPARVPRAGARAAARG